MSGGAPLSAAELPRSEQERYDAQAATLRGRRAAAARVRRRQLLVLDVAIAVVLALFGLIASPGLGILAVAGLAALALCAAWAPAARVTGSLRRRRGRRGAPRRIEGLR